MNPLLVRHLYGSVRRHRFFWLLTLYLLGVGILTLSFTLITALSTIITRFDQTVTISMLDLFIQGRVLYWFSSVLLILTASQLVPIGALGSLAGERDNRTLDLLVTTTLRSRDIIFGKLGAALLTGMVYLLAPLPLLMTGFWMGGVMPIELALTVVFLLVTMLVKISWALFLSSLVNKSIVAVLIFFGLNFAAIPVFFTGAAVFGTFYDAWYYSTTISLPVWLNGLIQYSWVILSMLNPIAAAGVTQAFGLEEGTWLILRLPVRQAYGMGGATLGTLYLPSPWIVYTLLSLAATIFFLFFCIQHLNKPARA